MGYRVGVVSSADDLAKVFAVRTAVYMVEQNCPYEEEFDGNDYCATHVLGTVDGEPAAVTRLRWFADFAKLERVAVVPRFRSTPITKITIEFSFELCRRKGYRKLFGHAQKRLIGFWEQHGMRALVRNSPIVYSDHEYVEVLAEFEPHPDAITMTSDPYVMVRPEGRWDAPGTLEHSARRPPTNPH